MMDSDTYSATNDTRHDACPLCCSPKFKNLGSIDYLFPVRFSTASITLSRVPELCKCCACGSRFVQNIVDEQTAKMLYSVGQAGDRWTTVPFEQNKSDEIVSQMAKLFKRKGKVLDIGCNTGELLDFARKFGCETAGVEFSSTSMDVLKSKGHRGFATLDEVPGGYEIITAFDLFEHLYDIRSFMKLCIDKLSPTGKLVILTGDVASLSSALAGSRWWYIKYPEHIVFPSKKYLRQKSGMRLDRCVSTYASKDYKHSIKVILSGIWHNVLRQRNYVGLPAIGPDHMLAILSK